MNIYGFQTLTLLDYPGFVACTVFLGHCNFRCPFCQNGNLVLHPEREPLIDEETVFSHLEKRKGLLDGVCITGGEPTLESELPDFLGKVREMGYRIKLDTNGYRPEVLKSLAEAGLVDYVAMDIKNSPDRYGETAGLADLDVLRIQESVEFLMCGAVDYEFRTTVARELHGRAEFERIGKWLAGCRKYCLQNYRESEFVLQPVFSAYSREQLERFRELLLRSIGQVEIRGVD